MPFTFVHFEFFEAERAVRPHFNRFYSISKCSSRSQILTPPFTGRRLQSATVVGTDVDTQLSIKFISETKFKQGSVKTSKSLTTGVFNSFKMSKSGPAFTSFKHLLQQIQTFIQLLSFFDLHKGGDSDFCHFNVHTRQGRVKINKFVPPYSV